MTYASQQLAQWGREMERTIFNVAEDDRQEAFLASTIDLQPLTRPTPFTMRVAMAFHKELAERQGLYGPKSQVARAWAEANDMPYVEVECPPHSWIRDGGSGAVCTHCGREITEVEKYAPSDVTIDDQERGM